MIKDIGYGGAIHSYKNYILRADEDYYKAFRLAFEQALSAIGELYLFQDDNLEPHLDNISEMLYAYNDKIDIVRNQIKFYDLSAEERDRVGRVDDRKALKAIAYLIKQKDDIALHVAALERTKQDKKYLILVVMLLCILYCAYVIFVRSSDTQYDKKLINQLHKTIAEHDGYNKYINELYSRSEMVLSEKETIDRIEKYNNKFIVTCALKNQSEYDKPLLLLRSEITTAVHSIKCIKFTDKEATFSIYSSSKMEYELALKLLRGYARKYDLETKVYKLPEQLEDYFNSIKPTFV
ncbi:hypothetical protein C9I98_10750 [Photobacterium sanctipauli]|uniref:Uncharacterized protein n=2 Tax=Photobacterium sanctipauli TaxID=1342794 RepID=A0A2T3NUI8_9GAMM|nr:hypothetical protein [Photobacterium sanctipauli]PSW19927.1 hypothetical protein C9I98_10750 [Photobacterium sanctipauli]